MGLKTGHGREGYISSFLSRQFECYNLRSLTREICELLGVELGHLGGKSHLSEHSLHVGLVDQGSEPTVHVLEGLPKNLIVLFLN